jgi:hypothetical protein
MILTFLAVAAIVLILYPSSFVAVVLAFGLKELATIAARRRSRAR